MILIVIIYFGVGFAAVAYEISKRGLFHDSKEWMLAVGIFIGWPLYLFVNLLAWWMTKK